ncbi:MULTISPECIES: DoxX family protein [Streptosporangium]|uniref:Oxidoreductase n=1 Tax=Streptosporangium brasiliense TaxID=47480 RepID=A0ABT9RA95_9ACTN|nr:DoxX family protein [Streptosporangium brasiliense]MDP9866178.1 putative oxidoreductase [Streptosporangium brasiliense]
MRRALYDLAALIARLVLGVIFIAHGWQKLSAGGVEATATMFASAGVPLPRVAAAFAIVVEFGGGVLLILGLLTPLVGLLIAADMLGAFFFVHSRAGVFVTEGGFELVGALGSAALLLAAGGAGRISLDHLIFGRRREARRRAENVPAYVPPIAAEPLRPVPPAAAQPPAQPPTAEPQPPTPPGEPQPPAPPGGEPRPGPPDSGPPPR